MSFGAFVAALFLLGAAEAQYKPNWESLDIRSNPSWYDEAKLGIFMHWGAYSVPSYGGGGSAAAWFWRYWTVGSKAFVDLYSFVNFMISILNPQCFSLN